MEIGEFILRVFTIERGNLGLGFKEMKFGMKRREEEGDSVASLSTERIRRMINYQLLVVRL